MKQILAILQKWVIASYVIRLIMFIKGLTVYTLCLLLVYLLDKVTITPSDFCSFRARRNTVGAKMTLFVKYPAKKLITLLRAKYHSNMHTTALLEIVSDI